MTKSQDNEEGDILKKIKSFESDHGFKHIYHNPALGTLLVRKGRHAYKFQHPDLAGPDLAGPDLVGIELLEASTGGQKQTSHKTVKTVKTVKSKKNLPQGPLEREREILKRLQGSQYFPTLHENEVVTDDTYGTPIVMEYIDGTTLNDMVLNESTTMNYKQRLEIIIKIAEALQVMHEKGIKHLDLKSANIMITKAGTIKIIDFGTSSTIKQDRPDPLRSLSVRSVPEISSGVVPVTAEPENAWGKQYSGASDDIFALAGVMIDVLAPTPCRVRRFNGMRRRTAEYRTLAISQLVNSIPNNSDYFRAITPATLYSLTAESKTQQHTFSTPLLAGANQPSSIHIIDYITELMRHGDDIDPPQYTYWQQCCRFFCSITPPAPDTATKSNCPTIDEVLITLKNFQRKLKTLQSEGSEKTDTLAGAGKYHPK